MSIPPASPVSAPRAEVRHTGRVSTPTAPTVAVVGAGSVGATTAYALLLTGVARRVVLHDINKAKLDAEVADLAHGVSFMPTGEITGSDDVEVCRDARIVVVTAGAKQQPGQTRMELAGSTIALTERLLPRLVEVAPDATYLMVTNPVDVVTYAALRYTGLPAHQLFGSGTVLDTARLRHEIAGRTGVAVQSVHAFVVGEHGDSEFPLWSSATIGGVPLLDWERQFGRLGEDERAEITDRVVHAAYTIIAGKGATNYAIGVSAARIVEAVLRDERRVMPVSTLVSDYHGIDDVCLSVPTVVDGRGADRRLSMPFTDAELAQLRGSAEAIRATARRFRL